MRGSLAKEHEASDELEMFGVGEEIKGLNGGEVIAGINKFARIAGKGIGGAGDVDEHAGCDFFQGGDDFVGEAVAWGINEAQVEGA